MYDSMGRKNLLDVESSKYINSIRLMQSHKESTQLRKQTFLHTTISVICEEIRKLSRQENSREEMKKSLRRLHALIRMRLL